MRLLRLELEGVGSWAQPVALDLSTLRLVAVTGPNGAGKSTLIEAIAIALYGRPVRTRQLDSLVSSGKDRLRVRLTFSHAGSTWRVTRERVRGRRSSAVLERLDAEHGEKAADDEDRWVEQARGVDPVDRALAKLLSLSREAFLTTSLLSQGDSARFCEADPRERKSLFRELLGLGRFDQMAEIAKEQRRSVEAAVAATSAEAERLEAEAALAPGFETALGELEARRQALAEQAAATRRRVEQARAARERIQALNDQAQRFEELAAQRSRAAQARRADDEAALRSAEQQLAQALRQVASIETALRSALDARTAVTATRQELESAKEAEASRAAKADAVTAQGLAARERSAGLQAALEQNEAILAEETERRGAIERGQDSCWVCGSHLDPAARRRILEQADARILELQADSERIRGELARLEATIAQLRGALRAERAEQAAAQARAEQVSKRLAGLEAEAARAGELQAALEQAKRQADEARRLADDIQERLGSRQDADPEAEELLRSAKAARDEAALLAATVPQAVAEEEEKRLEAQSSQAAEQAGELRAKLQSSQVAKRRAEELRTKLRNDERRAGALRVLERAWGPDGVPRMVAASALFELETTAAAVLEQLSSSGLQVRFALSRPSGKGEREALDIVVERDGEQLLYEVCSGGEQTRVALAVNLALAKLMRRRHGDGFDLLVADEPTALDDEGTRALTELLYGLQEEAGLVVVVTHLDAIAARLPEHIRVEPGPEGSGLEVIDAA
jgi:exonuclease SbcC